MAGPRHSFADDASSSSVSRRRVLALFRACGLFVGLPLGGSRRRAIRGSLREFYRERAGRVIRLDFDILRQCQPSAKVTLTLVRPKGTRSNSTTPSRPGRMGRVCPSPLLSVRVTAPPLAGVPSSTTAHPEGVHRREVALGQGDPLGLRPHFSTARCAQRSPVFPSRITTTGSVNLLRGAERGQPLPFCPRPSPGGRRLLRLCRLYIRAK